MSKRRGQRHSSVELQLCPSSHPSAPPGQRCSCCVSAQSMSRQIRICPTPEATSNLNRHWWRWGMRERQDEAGPFQDNRRERDAPVDPIVD
eukprot:1520540-Pyramimonas_sp.AAC.1